MSSEEEKRIEYCKQYNIHHLMELLAAKVLVERPENPFAYLRNLLDSVEESETHKHSYDPTTIHYKSTKEGVPSMKKITLSTFGLNNAGKTTLLSALGGNVDVNCTPTVGFTPVQFQTDEYDICIFDLGGAANFRGIWIHYYHDCHGIIYVIDSAADEAVVAESLEVLEKTLTHPYVAGKPLLVLANKKDLPESQRTEVVPEKFLETHVLPGTPYRVVATCGIEQDAELESGVEWLLQAVATRYDELAARVESDTAHVKEENERKRQERLAAIRGE